MSYVAAFRAYEWNESIAQLAARFFAACPDGRHVVLMNEEHGPIDVGAHEKIVHDADFAHLGLPERPIGRSLWFNGDYAYVHLRRMLPGYDHYLIIEADVAVNLSLEPMMRAIARDGIDLVVHGLVRCTADWHWYEAALAQEDPHTAGLFAMVASGRALDAMLIERQRLAMLARNEPTAPWPIVESFVVTTVRNAGMRIEEIGRYAGTELLRVAPAISLSDPDAHRPGSLVHPVLPPQSLLRRLLVAHAPADYRRPDSPLRTTLRYEPFASLVPMLWDGLERQGDIGGLAQLRLDMESQHLPPPGPVDLARCRPALVSSVCQWSATQDRAIEAGGANGVVEHANCAFHTDEEADAWWRVDLLDEEQVAAVEIVNRGDFSERFMHFAIETGFTGVDWAVRWTKTDDDPVSSEMSDPWRVRFDVPVCCRYLRIRRLGPPGFLHLRRVRVFGPPDEVCASSVAAPALLAEAARG